MDKQKDKQKQLAIDYHTAFDTDSGKRVLEDLSSKCYENRNTYVPGDTHHTAYHEGMRCVILNIRKMLAIDFNKKKQEKAKVNND